MSVQWNTVFNSHLIIMATLFVLAKRHTISHRKTLWMQPPIKMANYNIVE